MIDPWPHVPASSAKFLHQLGPSPFDGFQPTLDLPGFLVEIGQLLLEFFLVQVILPALFPDEGFDLLPQQPIPRLPCMLPPRYCSFPARMASNLHLRQAKLLPGGLVAQRGSLL